MENWHSLKVNEIFEKLESSPTGITSSEAKQRLGKFGLNELAEKKGETPLQMFLQQFKDFLILVLIAATVVSFLIGETIDALVILLIVVLNAILGFTQEYRAEKALAALKKMVSPTATVIRNGRQHKIPASTLVPGDVILLETGEKIPADIRLVEVANLKVSESALTGESEPVTKIVGEISGEKTLGDRRNIAYMGTTITYGRGKGVVCATGMGTEIGKIAEMIQTVEKEETPLQKKLEKLGKQLGAIVLILCTIIFVVGILQGKDLLDMFLTAVSLAVAAIPEGLPAIVTITLAIGLKRMVRSNAIVRKLAAVETLGSTDVICSDKTGTLTRDEMVIRKIYVNEKVYGITGEGYSPEGNFMLGGKKVDVQGDTTLKLILTSGTLCNNASLIKKEARWEVLGDPTESSIVVAARKAGLIQEELLAEYPRVRELPFDSERKRMSTVHLHGNELIAFVKGSPEGILDLCSEIQIGGKNRKINDEDKKRILGEYENFGGNALRVLAIAYRKLPKSVEHTTESVESRLTFLGLVGMIDPPREDAVKAIALCRKAGIKPIMITGDFKTTAVAIGKEMGLYSTGDIVLTGEELEHLTDDELKKIVEKVTIYARVNPEHKLRIVNALKSRGHVVAVTGDGVNDAPALKKSDIGVAMGITGTDVSKEAADMILVDDNFASIVKAVEEGRGIFDNIRKFVRYLLSCNVGEIMTIFFSMLFLAKLPLPLRPVQILWMNLVTDGLPAIALGVDPKDSDVMSRKPRSRREEVIDNRMLLNFLLTGLIISVGTLFLFQNAYEENMEKAQTVAFTTIVMFQLFFVFSCRSEKHSLLSVGLFTNKYLLLAVGTSVMLQIAVIHIPMLQVAFGTVGIGLNDWLKVIAVSMTGLLIPEILKYLKR